MSTPLDEYEAEMNAHNDLQRTRLAAYRAEHGAAWIGKINIYPPARAELVEFTGQLVRNFEADFAVPKPDPTLLRLIIERAESPYTGTAEDGRRIDAIFARIDELGGRLLTWR